MIIKDNFIYSGEAISNGIDKVQKSKRKWWLKRSNIIFFTFAVLMVILSFTHPDLSENIAYKIIFMIARVILILFIWYAFISPYLFKLFQKYIAKKKNSYSDEIENIILLFPQLRYLIKQTWDDVKHYKGLSKLKEFVLLTIARILVAKFK